eukprot:gene2273-2585_t
MRSDRQLSSGTQHTAAPVFVLTHSRRHTLGCAAAVGGSDTAAETSTADQEAVVDVQPLNAQPQTVQEAQNGLTGGWKSFLEQLWDRGYFKEHSSSNMQSAISSKRDTKKALQQLGRNRADILLRLPKPLIVKLAAVSLSPSEVAERKMLNAHARLSSAAAAAATMAAEDAATTSLGRASTQDLLRVLWASCNSAEVDSNTELLLLWRRAHGPAHLRHWQQSVQVSPDPGPEFLAKASPYRCVGFTGIQMEVFGVTVTGSHSNVRQGGSCCGG